MTISFGGCEADDSLADVNDWGNIFQSAQAEGISVFVSSGDSGAAGCDTSFDTPPSTAGPASPNAICSPIYETCVGGTEFNDTASPSTYWSSSSGTGLLSALSYIPEGAWNEPGDATNGFSVAGTGGGVSSDIATPPWQTGTGVPSARAGRYTPDVAFSASGHDAYFNCMAAGGGNCVVGSGGGFEFVESYGTSAAAPSMAGVTALLDQKMGGAQGNVAPTIYTLAASDPAAFHDVTVTSSGVTSCSVSTPSMCNNSVASLTALTGGTAGYAVQAGYDEATGWGSLDVNTFIIDYAGSSSLATPTVTALPGATSITSTQALIVNVTVSSSASNPTPTGSVTLASGSYTSPPATLSVGRGVNHHPCGRAGGGDRRSDSDVYARLQQLGNLQHRRRYGIGHGSGADFHALGFSYKRDVRPGWDRYDHHHGHPCGWIHGYYRVRRFGIAERSVCEFCCRIRLRYGGNDSHCYLLDSNWFQYRDSDRDFGDRDFGIALRANQRSDYHYSRAELCCQPRHR